MKVSRMWKAIAAAIVAGAGAMGTALNDSVLTSGEVWTVAGSVLGAFGLTWAVPNRRTPEGEDTDT